MYEWSDIRIFVAVAAEGSTLAAGRKLGLNQSTVSRRIQALEHALSLTLFERDTRGYALTPQGSAMVDVAGQMAAAAENVSLRAERLGRDVSGTIRITGAPELMRAWGSRLVRDFRVMHPDVVFEVDASDTQLSLENGEADVALRATDTVVGDTLVARKIWPIPWGVFGHSDYLKRHGTPASIAECTDRKFVFYADTLVERVKILQRFAGLVDPSCLNQRVENVSGMVGALLTEDALGLLPAMLVENTPDLQLCFTIEPSEHALWVVASKESHRQPRVRSFMAFVQGKKP